MDALNGLAPITVPRETEDPVNSLCKDDTSAPVKASTIDELHSLQKKKSAPTTPKGFRDADDALHLAQLESIRWVHWLPGQLTSQLVRCRISMLSGACRGRS